MIIADQTITFKSADAFVAMPAPKLVLAIEDKLIEQAVLDELEVQQFLANGEYYINHFSPDGREW